MSAKHLPARPSMEHLRKQAKELLKRLRSVDPSAKLSTAQRELALEYGFRSWPKLVAHIEEVRDSARIDHFERLADDMLAGYGGDPAALSRLIAYFGVSYNEEQVRVRLRKRIDDARDEQDDEPSLEQVREIVAREFGRDSWAALVNALVLPTATTSGSGASRGEEPPFYTYDAESDTIEPRGPMTLGDWRRLADVMSERRITRLRAPSLTDEGLAVIATVESLTALDVDGAQGLTDAGVLQLARLPGLRELALGGYHSPLGDGALSVLEQLPELRSFSMSWAQEITDAGVVKLAHCPRLERVDLMGTLTGDGGIRALSGHASLRRLATGRLVTDDGVEALADLPFFAQVPTAPIDLHTMSFSPGPGALLLDGRVTDGGLARLATLPGLQSLDLFWHAAAFTATGLAELGAAPSLAYLGCQGERCTDEAMAAIATIKSLRMLMAQGTVATDRGFASLATSDSLEYLWGRECPNLGDGAFAALSSMPTLRGLGVSLDQVSDAQLEAFGDFPALTELVPILLDDAAFGHVGRASRLERLWCMYCRETGDAATDAISHLPLRTYYAGSTKITDHSMDVLAGMRTVEEVELYKTPAVTSAGVSALKRLPKLRRIEVTGLPRVRSKDLEGFGEGVRARYVP